MLGCELVVFTVNYRYHCEITPVGYYEKCDGVLHFDGILYKKLYNLGNIRLQNRSDIGNHTGPTANQMVPSTFVYNTTGSAQNRLGNSSNSANYGSKQI